MTELLFGVTVAFVGYVLYEVFKTVSNDKGPETPAEKTAIPAAKAAVESPAAKPAPEPKPAPQPAAAKAEPAPKPAAVKAEPAPAKSEPAPKAQQVPAKPEPPKAPAAAAKSEPKAKPAPPKAAPAASAPATEDRGGTLRNPATGETSPVPTNYRFAKKWIKEALVAEGLLDHIYKPNELDDAASDKVKDAIDKFRALDKYQP
jgi:type IV secretory pathway VirB10-like protein